MFFLRSYFCFRKAHSRDDYLLSVKNIIRPLKNMVIVAIGFIVADYQVLSSKKLLPCEVAIAF